MKTVVGFLSRAHGYDALNALVKSEELEVLVVYTHALNPKSQDLQRNIRDDYNLFIKICEKNHIPLVAVDSKKNGD